MKNYEIVLIFHPGNSNLVSKILEKYVSFIKEQGGLIHRIEDWGRKHLSYPIKKVHKGHYILMNIEVLIDTINNLEKKIRFDENILRNLIISVNKIFKSKSPMALLQDLDKKSLEKK